MRHQPCNEDARRLLKQCIANAVPAMVRQHTYVKESVLARRVEGALLVLKPRMRLQHT